MCPGTRSFPFGTDLMELEGLKKEGAEFKYPYAWFLDFVYGQGVPDSYKPEEHGDCQLICMIQRGTLLISDPDMVQDLFTIKNKIVDKISTSEFIFRNLLGNSFLFSKTDAVWK